MQTLRHLKSFIGSITVFDRGGGEMGGRGFLHTKTVWGEQHYVARPLHLVVFMASVPVGNTQQIV